MSEELVNLLKRFDAAMDASDFSGARERLTEALTVTGDRADILAAYGHLSLNLGQTAAAEDAAWRSVAIEPDHDETLKLLGRLSVQFGRSYDHGLQRLPGNHYARYLIPLDYPPSRRLAPRWGYGQPVHKELTDLFEQNQEHYKTVLTELRTLVPHFQKIPTIYSVDTAGEPGWVGPPVNAIDLALLYYFVWKFRPSSYLEIGSGSTTSFARRAVTDHQLSTRIFSIDPEPRSSIDNICDEVIRDGLETLPSLEVFATLQPGDIVFLDGSHRCFMNSDVTVFFLEVLPRLKPGVIIHIHDIALPLDYPESFKTWYWNEQYVLAAYLLGARAHVRILMPCQYITSTPALSDYLKPPLLSGVGHPDSWTIGGSFWFTHV